MVHVQDEGHDAIGSGQRIREHREKLFIRAFACSIRADELEQGRGIRAARNHEQDGNLRLRTRHAYPQNRLEFSSLAAGRLRVCTLMFANCSTIRISSRHISAR